MGGLSCPPHNKITSVMHSIENRYNENEERLLEDVVVFLRKLAPESDRYLHAGPALKGCATR